MAEDLIKKFEQKRSLMIKYKETMNEDYFNQLLEDRIIKKLFTGIARKKIFNCPTTLHDIDDLVSVGYIEMWRSIINYKYICPVCNLKALTQEAYKKHVIKHGSYFQPKPAIEKHVFYNVGVYMQNCIRDEYSTKNKTNHSLNQVNMFSPSGELSTQSDSMLEFRNIEKLHFIGEGIENEVLFKMISEAVVSREDDLTQRIFNTYLKGTLKCDIAKDLYQEGIYKSEQSAAVMVSRKIKDIMSKFIRYYKEQNN